MHLKRKAALERLQSAYCLIYEGHEEMRVRADNMEKKMLIYEREIAD